MEMTFEQVLRVALSLRPEQKAVLIKTLQVSPSVPVDPTRAQFLAELEALRAAGAFEHVRSLRNQYPTQALRHISDKQLLAAVHETANVWEADLAELSDHGN